MHARAALRGGPQLRRQRPRARGPHGGGGAVGDRGGVERGAHRARRRRLRRRGRPGRDDRADPARAGARPRGGSGAARGGAGAAPGGGAGADPGALPARCRAVRPRGAAGACAERGDDGGRPRAPRHGRRDGGQRRQLAGREPRAGGRGDRRRHGVPPHPLEPGRPAAGARGGARGAGGSGARRRRGSRGGGADGVRLPPGRRRPVPRRHAQQGHHERHRRARRRHRQRLACDRGGRARLRVPGWLLRLAHHLGDRRGAPRGRDRAAHGRLDGGPRRALAPARAAGAPHARRLERARAGRDHGGGRARLEPGGAAGARHRGHPARAHGAARACRLPRGGRARRAGRGGAAALLRRSRRGSPACARDPRRARACARAARLRSARPALPDAAPRTTPRCPPRTRSRRGRGPSRP